MASFVLGGWKIGAVFGAFFLVQPLLIAAERRLAVRRWRPAAGRAWTLTALAITSPLVIEPSLQFLERYWGAPDNVLLPTLAALGFIITLSGIVSLVSLAASPAANRVWFIPPDEAGPRTEAGRRGKIEKRFNEHF
jgi:hypothetical protein